jgi:hypothetical protein
MTGSLPVLASSSQSSPSASSTVVDIVISVAVLGFILYRQRQVRRASPTLVLPVVLIVIGLFGVISLSKGPNKLTSAEVGILIALLALDAVGLGAVRALTVRLWHDGGAVLRQGTWLTVGLWLVGIVIHETVDLVAHIPSTSLILYLGLTLLAQQLVLQARVNRMAQQTGTPAGQPGQGVPT